MLEKPSACSGCPAQNVGRGFVPGMGPLPATYAIIGQGPGEVEAHEGKPFIGPAGRKLNVWLSKAGLHREEAWVDNIVRCWLPGNRAPTQEEVDFCTRAHLEPALDALADLEIIVPVGIPSARYFLATKAGEGSAGSVHRIQRGEQGWIDAPLAEPTSVTSQTSSGSTGAPGTAPTAKTESR